MTTTERILSIVIGLAGVVWAFVPGGTFYPGMMGISDKSRPLPNWYGRLFFVGVGLAFIYFGLKK